MKRREDVIIIGAGLGGMSAAIHLAVAGKRVTILEQNPQVGGKMGFRTDAGFYWDTGPSVITMKPVLERLFEVAGRRLDDYLELQPIDPLTRYFYPNGTVLNVTRDWVDLAEQIGRIDPSDIEGYLAYLRYVAELYRITRPIFIEDHPPTWRSFLRVPVRDWFKIDPFQSMATQIEKTVQSAELRQLFGRFATYVGSSPYLAPATLNVIAHVELTGGVYYPKGGIYQIALAYQRLAEELGVTIETNSPVDRILVRNRRVVGCELENGTQLNCRTILSNVDVFTTYQRFLPPEIATASRLQKLDKIESSCSGFVMLLGVAKEHRELAHHNIWFPKRYKAEFDDIFGRQHPADDPAIYATITSKSDPAHAPAGCENWFVLVNAPALSCEFDWSTQAISYGDHIIGRLAERGIDLKQHIVTRQILTPVDLQKLTGAHRGALYGSSSNHPFAAFLRPHNRCPHLRGLYFAGGTAHPGGGVPMVTLSGRVAAELILRDG